MSSSLSVILKLNVLRALLGCCGATFSFLAGLSSLLTLMVLSSYFLFSVLFTDIVNFDDMVVVLVSLALTSVNCSFWSLTDRNSARSFLRSVIFFVPSSCKKKQWIDALISTFLWKIIWPFVAI